MLSFDSHSQDQEEYDSEEEYEGEGEYAIFDAKHKDLRGREDIIKSVTHQS